MDAAATMDDEGNVTIFAVNRDLEEPVALKLDMRAFGEMKTEFHTVLHHDDMKAVNTEENPDEVKPVQVPVQIEDGKLILPAASWNVIRFAPAK